MRRPDPAHHIPRRGRRVGARGRGTSCQLRRQAARSPSHRSSPTFPVHRPRPIRTSSTAGASPQGDHPWWVADNGTDVSTLYNGRRDDDPARRQRRGRSDRRGVQRHRRPLPGHTTATDTWHPALHLLERGRDDPRLARRLAAALVTADSRRRGDLQGTRDRDRRRATPVRDRLPQRAGRRLRRRLGSSTPPARSSTRRAGRLRAVRNPDDRRTVFVTYAKQDADARRRARRPGPRLRRRVRPRRHFVTRWPSAGSSTRRGASRWRPRRSGGSRATCSSATSATARSTPTRDRGGSSTAARCESRRRQARDRRAVGAGVRQRQRQRRPNDALLHRRPQRRVETGSSARSRAD